MKALLLTDVPPCTNYSGALVLDQLCRFLPPGSLACFAATHPLLAPVFNPELNWLPIATTHNRKESACLRFRRPFKRAGKVLVEAGHRAFTVPQIARLAETYAREQRVDRIWAALQGQTMAQIAPWLARRLNLPLVTLVWDPLSWWLHANHVDRWNGRKAHADFDAAMRASRACAVASWAMAEEYEARYGTHCIPIIASHAADAALHPEVRQPRGTALTIGMAGQFYAGQEWAQLVRALNMAGWKVNGKSVTIQVLGPQEPEHDAPPGRINYLGYRSQAEAAGILSGCDILYCPYPFAPEMHEVARLSFPSKLVLYFRAGRPVLFHGPPDSSPAIYLARRDAGVCVTDFHAAALYNGLCDLVADAELYARVALNGQRAFRDDFTLDTMRSHFLEFLGTTEAELAAVQGPPAGTGSVRVTLPTVMGADIQAIRRWGKRLFGPLVNQ